MTKPQAVDGLGLFYSLGTNEKAEGWLPSAFLISFFLVQPHGHDDVEEGSVDFEDAGA